MIEIAEKRDIRDIRDLLEAVCKHLKIKIIPNEYGDPMVKYTVVEHWPFEGGFPKDPLDNRSEFKKICESAEMEYR